MSLVITGVYDGPLTGGVPKGIELYVRADIADLSVFGVGGANNGGGTDGEEFTFPAVAIAAGTYLYVSSEVVEFQNFFGFAPDYTSSSVNINGDDAVELFENGTIIDTFGDPNVDGNGEVWEYLDGWASRNPGSTANPTFSPADWSFSGPNALDGEVTNATAATPIPLGSFVQPTPAATFVINEVDVDQTGTDSAEFIEIYDGGVGNSSLDGLSLVLFNGNGEAAYNTILLEGLSTNADGYFVVGSANVPNVDLAVFTTNGLQNGADAVGIYTGTPPAIATTENLVDAVVYGTADADDGDLLTLLGQTMQFDEDANATSETDSVSRETDGTGAFVTQAATPGESNFIAPPPVPTEITLISAIQGNGGTQDGAVVGVDDRSAFENQIVTISAIVTADFQAGLFGTQGDQNGFYIQEEEIDYDFDDLSSEGIFIFDGTNPLLDLQIGDLVEVTGTVNEFFGQTQISATNITVIASDQVVPDAVEVTFPTASIMDDGSGNFVANLEAYEGMRVNIAQDLTVSELFNLDRFGQYNVTSDGRVMQFTQNNDPDAAGYAEHLRDTAARTLVLDDGLSVQNPDQLQVIDGNDGILTASDSFRMGDTISGINGVISYSFGEFQISAPEGTYEQENERPLTPQELGGNFTVASLNVLNYFTTIDEVGVITDNGSDPRGADSDEEFERQAEKLVNALVAMDAAVVGLIEIENDFSGVVIPIADIVDRVNAELGSEIYAYVDPGQEFIGGDAISNGLIYKIDEVGLQGDMAILAEFEGRNFLDPLDAGRSLNRPAVAQTFVDLDTDETITITVNHLKSKGSLSGLNADEDQGDGQGNNNATRTEAADILVDWLASDPTGQGSENTLILGDLNAYARENPLTILADAGYTDLAAQELGDDAYSYVFDGQIGTLDYALANDALSENLVGVTEWHVNADEADALDYNLDFDRDATLFDADSAARNSDHDPVIVSFQFEPVINMIAGTNGRDFLAGTTGRDEIDGLGGNDILIGSAGEDTLSGGVDIDILLYRGSDAGVTVDLNIDLVSGMQTATGGHATGDEIQGFENVRGSDFDDALTGNDDRNVLIGDAGNDNLSGGAGNDVLRGGAGADTLSGGDGVDILQYADTDAGVTVDLNIDLVSGMQTATGGHATGDEIQGFETVRGSDFDDALTGNDDRNVLIGDAGNDILSGGAGNDVLRGGAGADALEGGDDVDILLYGGSDAGVTVDLNIDLVTGMQTATGGHASGDQIQGFENVRGSDFDDVLTGNDDRNVLVGDAGNDNLVGGAGNDVLRGGAGSDALEGGDGADVFIFDTDLKLGNVDVISDFIGNEDRIRLQSDIYNGLAAGVLDFELFGANATGEAETADQRIIYDTTTGALFFDGDGNGTGTSLQFASLSTNLALSETDFFVL
jgi:predicted extracellular nuclease